MAKKRKTKHSTHTPASESGDVLYLTEYEITSEPIEDRAYRRLSPSVKEQIETLHYEAQARPHQAIPKLHELNEKYPQIPVLYNFLVAAYFRIGEKEKAEAILKDALRRHPDYLFTRLNYAEICLARKEYDKIAEIFEHKFDLKMLYPKRKKFHISEVANFMGFMGIYFLEIGEREAAERYYDILKDIAPDFPMVKRVKRRLYPGLLGRLSQRVRGRLLKSESSSESA